MVKLTEQVHFRVTEEEKAFLDNHGDISELFRKLLAQYRCNGYPLFKQKNNIEQELQYAKAHVLDLELKLEMINHEIEALEKKKSLRPEGYDEVLNRLLHMPIVTAKDIEFQAESLGVELYQLQQWLSDDDFFMDRLR